MPAGKKTTASAVEEQRREARSGDQPGEETGDLWPVVKNKAGNRGANDPNNNPIENGFSSVCGILLALCGLVGFLDGLILVYLIGLRF